MIESGLTLMVLGMLVVFTYLTLMIYLINFSSKLLAPLTRKEQQNKPAAAPKNKPKAAPDDNTRKLAAVVTAAIQAHQSKN